MAVFAPLQKRRFTGNIGLSSCCSSVCHVCGGYGIFRNSHGGVVNMLSFMRRSMLLPHQISGDNGTRLTTAPRSHNTVFLRQRGETAMHFSASTSSGFCSKGQLYMYAGRPYVHALNLKEMCHFCTAARTRTRDGLSFLQHRSFFPPSVYLVSLKSHSSQML